MQFSIEGLDPFLNSQKTKAAAQGWTEADSVIPHDNDDAAFLVTDGDPDVPGVCMPCAVRQCLLNHTIDTGALRFR